MLTNDKHWDVSVYLKSPTTLNNAYMNQYISNMATNLIQLISNPKETIIFGGTGLLNLSPEQNLKATYEAVIDEDGQIIAMVKVMRYIFV